MYKFCKMYHTCQVTNLEKPNQKCPLMPLKNEPIVGGVGGEEFSKVLINLSSLLERVFGIYLLHCALLLGFIKR